MHRPLRFLGVALLAAALAACTGTPGEGGGDGGDGGAGEERVISANDREFDLSGFTVPAGEAFTVRLNNGDDVEHNFSIYTEEGGEALFQGETVEGGDSIEYDVSALEPGEYYFQCDIHPDMNGTVTVEESE